MRSVENALKIKYAYFHTFVINIPKHFPEKTNGVKKLSSSLFAKKVMMSHFKRKDFSNCFSHLENKLYLFPF